MERFPERRLIVAIDDLDKRDPATVLAALIEARSTLHTDCAFVLTGHPLGILRNIYSTAGGIFDSQINLEVLPPEDMRTILVNYLEAGRSKKTPFHGIHPFTEETVEIVLKRSLGIPRLLNKICQQILEKAAELRLPIIDLPALQECWTLVSGELRRAMGPEVIDLLNVLREQTGNFAAPQVPDDIYERLGIDSHQQLLTLLSAAVTEDIAVGIESAGQTRFLPNPLFEDLTVEDA